MRADQSETPAGLFSIEAEQQLLGAILTHSETIDTLGPLATPDIFAADLHRDLFAAVLERHKRGELVSAVSMRLWAEGREDMAEVGGAKYLVRLVGASIASSQARHYADMLEGLRAKREIARAVEQARAELDRDDTSAEIVAGRLEAALASGWGRSQQGPVSMTAATTEMMRRIKSAQEGETVAGIVPGIPALADIVPLLKPGQLVLLGGRPSMGKSAVAVELALQAALAGKSVCFASLEMSADDLVMRMAAQRTGAAGRGVNFSDFEGGQLSPQQYETVTRAAREIHALPIEFLPEDYRDVGALYAGAKQCAARMGGLDLFVVDYLQLLRAPGKGRYDQITEISIALKSLAMQLKVPVLALTQLSRQCEQRDEKRPMLSDLRESGQLEQDADAVIFCYRDAYYVERDRPGDNDPAEAHQEWAAAMERVRNRLELIVAKQRQGRIGTAHLNYNPALNVFWGR